MRIAHVLRRLSFSDWGGTEQVVWNLAKAQKAAGHDVRIFATTAMCATAREEAEGLTLCRYDAIYPWWPMSGALKAELDLKGGNPFVPGLGKALREWRPDVIHCHAMARIAELCIRTARKLGVPCVVSLHGGALNVPGEEAKSLRSPTRRLLPWGKALDYMMGWVRRVPEDADGIVCVGEDEYRRYSERHAHVMFLPNGVDAARFAALHAGDVQRPVRTLLCVARIDRQKNQMMLVEALARHPELSVRLVGPVTQPDYLAEMKKRAAELGVSGRLAFAGPFKPGSDELVAEYANADAFVLPSRHEPFGIVVLEAWAAGLPVVASDVGGLGKLCAAHPGAAMTFAPGDADALDAALARLCGGNAVRRAMSKAGREAAMDYDWRKLCGRLMDFYGELGTRRG